MRRSRSEEGDKANRLAGSAFGALGFLRRRSKRCRSRQALAVRFVYSGNSSVISKMWEEAASSISSTLESFF